MGVVRSSRSGLGSNSGVSSAKVGSFWARWLRSFHSSTDAGESHRGWILVCRYPPLPFSWTRMVSNPLRSK